jgi:hypothetical protein
MKGLIPSQTCGLRRMLEKHFTVVDTPEWNTTKTCSKCEEGEMKPCMKRFHPNPKRTKGENSTCKFDVRGLRRCNNENCRVFINRDYNAAINIRSNLVHYIKHGRWDSRFTSKPKDTGTEASMDQLRCSHKGQI